MKTRHVLLALVLAVAAAIVPILAAPSAAPRRAAIVQPELTAMQALPLTCAQAWIASEKDYTRMRKLVIALAKVSLVNRDLTFPDQRAAGVEAGKGIADDCKADPNALLFALVDKQVRRLGRPAAR